MDGVWVAAAWVHALGMVVVLGYYGILGRIVLPAHMKAAADIAQDVVFVGARQRMELWNPEKWREYEKQHGAGYEQKLGAVVKDVFGL